MRARAIALVVFVLLLEWPAAKAPAFLLRVANGTTATQSITAVALSGAIYSSGASAGTVIGSVSVTMSPSLPAFSGTLALTGSAAADFSLSSTSLPANLITNSSTPSCPTTTATYNINIVATQNGVHGTPFTQAETITCNPVNGDPTVGVLPSYNDAYVNWQNAGLQGIGGIPARSTQCGSTVSPSGLTPPATGDDASLITAAIAACSAGDVVQLSSGTFQIAMSELPLYLGKGISIRGGPCTNTSSPFCSTVLNIYNGLLDWTGGKCGVNTGSEVACAVFPAIIIQPGTNPFDFGWASCSSLAPAINCGAVPLAADAAQGQTTIQVSTTAGFSVGGWVLIDEASGATWQNDPVGPNIDGQVWAAADWLSASGSPTTGRAQWSKYGGPSCSPSCSGDMGSGQYPYNQPNIVQGYYDRPTSEIHLIKSIGAGPCPGVNCTLTFDDPLMIAFRQSGAGTFTGTISGNTLTTTGDPCKLTVAQIVSDIALNVRDGTYVTAVNSCSGGAGNYTVNGAAQSVSSETMIYAAHQAHVYPPTNGGGTSLPFLQFAGLENLTISRPPANALLFQFCAYCWTKNVEVVNWFGGGINFTYSVRDQIDTTLVNNCGFSVNSGGEYPIGFQDASTEIYMVNSITRLCGKGMVGKTGSGNVIAYSYIDDQMYDSYSGIGDYWAGDMSVNGSHFVGTHHFLFEGNWGANLDNDDTHGNAVYHTYFRNWGTGIRTTFTDPSIPATVNDAAGIGYACGTTGGSSCFANAPYILRVAGPMLHDYWLAYVGNVLGVSGVTTSGNGWTYSGDFTTNKHIWIPGWNSNNGSDSDPNLTGATGTFLFRHGDYDYVNGAIVDWTTGYSHTLPNSFYLSAEPSFFTSGASCSYSWPWVTSTGSTPIQSPTGPGSCSSYSGLPAKARWDAGTPFVQP